MIAKEEAQSDVNEDFSSKFRVEKEKHDTLLDELVQLRENLKLTKEIEVLTDKKIELQTVD